MRLGDVRSGLKRGREERRRLLTLRGAGARQTDSPSVRPVVPQLSGTLFPICPAPAKRLRGTAPLRDKLGDRFKAGIVLYTGTRTLSFGERLAK